MGTIERINDFIKNEEENNDCILIDKIVDFIDMTDPDTLSEEQNELLEEILEELDMENELNEATTIRKKISPQERRKRAKAYRKNKSKIKRAQKKYKRSAKGKKTKKLSKRMGKLGKTSTGKRKSTYI